VADYTIKKLGDMEAIFFGSFKKAGSELAVGSFGMNIFDMPPNTGEQYPEHNHEHDSQEEVYVVLKGSGRIVVDGEEVPVDGETVIRCGPGVTRKIFAGDEGMRVLALGGVPGQAYKRPEVFEKGAPDPTVQS
jgi:mannose-6-phosphate isomerase-like protein (cupin superfamily)